MKFRLARITHEAEEAAKKAVHRSGRMSRF